ncbi:unnamed protein product, partial [Brassica rapa subsp. trilocularis]
TCVFVFFLYFLFFSSSPLFLIFSPSKRTGASVQSAFSLVFSSPSRSVSFLQSPSCPSFSSPVFSVGKGSVSSPQSPLVQSLRPHLLSLLTVGALRDSSRMEQWEHLVLVVSQSGAVLKSNTTQDEADVSTRVTELGVEGSRIHLHSSTSNQKQVIFFLFKKLKLRNYHCSLKIR